MKRLCDWKRRVAAIILAASTCFTPMAFADQPIRIGWLPDPNVGFYIAREKKLFEKEGLRPEYIKFLSGPAMFAALQSKSIDIAEMGMAPSVIAKGQGIDVKVLAVSVDVSNTDVLLSQSDVEIKTAGDLKGKKVASVRGSSPYFGLVEFLKSGGLRIDDITFVDLSAQNVVPAFRRKEVDAAWIWSPWQNMIIAAGGKRVTSNFERSVFVPNVWVTRREWAESEKSTVQSFLRAFDAAIGEVRRDEKLAIGQLAETLNVDREIAAQILKDARYTDFATQFGPSDPLSLTGGPSGSAGLKGAMQRAASFLMSQGMIKSEVNVDELLDVGPVKAYLQAKK